MVSEAAKEAAVAAVNDKELWTHYFHSIRKVCPWSYSAWKRGKIDIAMWRGIANELEDLEARVYVIYGDIKPRLLKKIEQRLNGERQSEEWLHSHPLFGINSTPVPVLIQQDREGLEKARKQSNQ